MTTIPNLFVNFFYDHIIMIYHLHDNAKGWGGTHEGPENAPYISLLQAPPSTKRPSSLNTVLAAWRKKDTTQCGTQVTVTDQETS